MTTTLTTPVHHAALKKTVFWLAIVALLVAVTSLGATAYRVVSGTSTFTGTAVTTTTGSTQGQLQYQDQPTGHLQRGPVPAQAQPQYGEQPTGHLQQGPHA